MIRLITTIIHTIIVEFDFNKVISLLITVKYMNAET